MTTEIFNNRQDPDDSKAFGIRKLIGACFKKNIPVY